MWFAAASLDHPAVWAFVVSPKPNQWVQMAGGLFPQKAGQVPVLALEFLLREVLAKQKQ